MPGRTFHLREHPIPTLDGPYVVTRVRHNAYASGFAPTHMPMYSNEIEVIPSNVPARPPAPSRVLRQVTETATVVGPADSEIHADALGRIKVQFHWDLQGQRDDKSSAWVRVAHTLAGAGWGSQFIPRVGMEVLVTFLGGDLDRPVVTHALYNATHPPPFALPGEKTKSGLRTRSTPHATGFHEVSFDDDAGKELLFIHAQRDATRVVEHDDAERVGNAQRVDIGVDRETKIGRRDHTVVGEEQTSAVAGSGTGTGMKKDSILLTTGGATLALAGSDAALTANGDLLLQAGGTATLKAPTVIVEAGIVQINGESVITIVSGGPVTVKGANVDIKGATITEN